MPHIVFTAQLQRFTSKPQVDSAAATLRLALENALAINPGWRGWVLDDQGHLRANVVGANPTPMAFPEVYAGLESKAIDGQENPFSVILANKLFEVQKFLAVSNHQYNPQSMIFSKKVWDTLSAAEQKILKDAAVEAGMFQRKTARDAAAGQLDQLKKNGMTVTELSGAEQAKLPDKFKPVIDKHGAAIAATLAELQVERAKARK